MRLTLRTLLAYLDDTLEPAQARLIGQKVAESPAAQELIARIKQVTRRRRLTTPPLTGPEAKVDPNTIAEYLDNILSPEQLAEVEEVCLGSDVHLAEVAACHQILTLVLGQPAPVPPTARQRMYGLVHGPEAIPGRKALAPALGQGALETPPPHEDDADEALLLGLPRYGSGNWLRWAVPLAAACILLAAGLAIWRAVVSGPPGVSQVAPPTNSNPAPGVQAVPAVQEPANSETPATPQKKPEPSTNPEAKPPPEKKPEPSARPETKPPPEKKPESPARSESGLAGGVGPGAGAANGRPNPESRPPTSQGAATKPEPTPMPPANPPPSPIQPPSTERRELGQTALAAGEPSILLARQAGGEAWKRLGVQRPVFATDYLVSLPGYHSELRLERGLHVLLWGSLQLPVLESSVTLYANPAFDLDFKLDRGRVVLSNHKDGPGRVRLRFHDQVWDLTLPDKTSEVAVELFGYPAPSTKQPAEPPFIRVLVWGLRGEAELQAGYEKYLLPNGAVIPWDNGRGLAGPPQKIALPEWWTNRLPQTREARAMQAALDGLSKRLLDSDTIDVAVAEAARAPDPASRVLAIRCWGALDDWSHLLDALTDGQRADVRFLAVDELRHLLGLSARNNEKLLAALKQKYPPRQAETIDQLLHGLSQQQWADPNTKASLLDQLTNDKLAIRQLAYQVLLDHVPEGRQIPYDAAGDSAQRERGYQLWRRRLLEGSLPGGRESRREGKQ